MKNRAVIDRNVGLCSICIHAKRVGSARGSVFWLCRRAAQDRRFPKYPWLPLERCAGFASAGATPRAGVGIAGEQDFRRSLSN